MKGQPKWACSKRASVSQGSVPSGNSSNSEGSKAELFGVHIDGFQEATDGSVIIALIFEAQAMKHGRSSGTRIIQCISQQTTLPYTSVGIQSYLLSR